MLRRSPGASRQRTVSLPVRVSSLILFLAVVLNLVGATKAFAQDPKTKHWGVGFSATPQWKANQFFQDLLIIEDGALAEGTEFTFGVVRGSTLGGEWGVSYVRKRIQDGYTTTETYQETQSNSTFGYMTTTTFHNVYHEGVEVHFFMPVVNVKNRVQIGVNVAGGVGLPRGTVDEVVDSFSTFQPPTGPPITQTQHDEYSTPAKDYLLALQPLGKVEAQVSFIVIPSIKANVMVGMNMPSAVAFRFGATYLIGAK